MISSEIGAKFNKSVSKYFKMTPRHGISTSKNSFQIAECSNSRQCLTTNFVGQLPSIAYFDSGTTHPVYLTSCYADPQSNFNYPAGNSYGNVIYSQGSCQGIQYLIPFPGINNIQPVVPVVLPNGSTLPLMDYNLAYFTPISRITNNQEVTSDSLRGLNSIPYKHPSSENYSQNEICQSVNENNMPKVWHHTFDKLFNVFADHWTLIPTPDADPDISFVAIMRDSAKVRFMCRECRNAWTSMKGCIVFWINIDHNTRSGEVYFRLFGQQCQKCKSKEFQYAMWYPEEVEKVLKNLHVRIGNMFYGFPNLEFDKCRRLGKPRSPHNSSLCQACFNKVCTKDLK